MSFIVAFVAGVIGSLGVGAATAAIIAEIVVGSILAAGLSMASKALIGKPKSLLDSGQTLSFRAAAAPAPLVYGETRVGGPIVFMGTSGWESQNDNKLLWIVQALAGHEVDSIGAVYFNDEAVSFDAENYAGALAYNMKGGAIGTQPSDPGGGLREHAWMIKRLGAYNQTVNPNMRSRAWIRDVITDADTFRGIAHLSATFLYQQDPLRFPNGPPNMSAIVRGRKVYDPRNGAHDMNNPATWSWSDNPALCLVDYIRGVPMLTAAGVVERPYGLQASDADVDWSSVIAAANICDELVPIAGGLTQKRYTCNGTIDSDLAPKDALVALVSSMAGSVAWSGGLWRIFAGAYRTPLVTLGDDDQCGPARTQARRARRDLFNGVKGKFLGPATYYQTGDFPAVSSAIYVAQDNGEEIWQDVELPFTDTASMCQRIAKIELLRNRMQITTERRFKLSALATQVGDVILLNDARKGWTAKPFEITRWALATEQDENGVPFLCVDMTLVETASSVYAWTSADDAPMPSQPTTTLPRPWDVRPPGGPALVEDLYTTREGSGVKTRLYVSWADAGEGFFADYVPEYKLTSDAAWTVLPPVTTNSVTIFDVAAGIYDFRVRTRNTLGVFSTYATASGLTVYGLGATPAQLQGLGIQPLGNQAMLAWVQSPDLDVREGGRIEFRHSPAFAGVSWANSSSIREAVNGQQSYAVVPLKAGTYVIRAVDSSGIAGPETTVSSKQASINGYTSLGGSPVTESPGFAGGQSNTVASPFLKLGNALLWDAIADFDALAANIDEAGGSLPSGTYTFAGAYDFGAVTRLRLTSSLTGSVTSSLENIDDKASLIDEWGSFDGQVVGGKADAWVEFRQTDDNPGASPTWSPWMRLDTAEVECRGAQFRAQLVAVDPSYNYEITALSVAAETRV